MDEKTRPDGLKTKVTYPGSGRTGVNLSDSRLWAVSRLLTSLSFTQGTWRQVTEAHWASVSSSVKWGRNLPFRTIANY